jgi:hypothetical protein
LPTKRTTNDNENVWGCINKEATISCCLKRWDSGGGGGDGGDDDDDACHDVIILSIFFIIISCLPVPSAATIAVPI